VPASWGVMSLPAPTRETEEGAAEVELGPAAVGKEAEMADARASLGQPEPEARLRTS